MHHESIHRSSIIDHRSLGSLVRYQLAFYREAEIKHARLAMMAAAGWPVAELWDSKIAAFFGLPSVLEANDGLNPALLNGGLFEVRSFIQRKKLESSFSIIDGFHICNVRLID